MVFLVTEVPAWFINRDKRLSKTPKIYLNDTGLAYYFKQVTGDVLQNDRNQLGALLENFVVMELKKQITWHEMRPNMYHLRTQSGIEVDVVLEGPNKKIVGIEVKSSTKVDRSDLSGLLKLKELAGDKFSKGIILYGGDQVLSLGDQFYALPINSLRDID